MAIGTMTLAGSTKISAIDIGAGQLLAKFLAKNRLN